MFVTAYLRDDLTDWDEIWNVDSLSTGITYRRIKFQKSTPRGGVLKFV